MHARIYRHGGLFKFHVFIPFFLLYSRASAIAQNMYGQMILESKENGLGMMRQEMVVAHIKAPIHHLPR
jgi:hypothetical protein